MFYTQWWFKKKKKRIKWVRPPCLPTQNAKVVLTLNMSRRQFWQSFAPEATSDDVNGVSCISPLCLKINCLSSFSQGTKTVQSWEAEVQRGSRDVKSSSASQHCAILWLLGVPSERKEVHCSSDRANDIWDPKNVRFIWKNLFSIMIFLWKDILVGS